MAAMGQAIVQIEVEGMEELRLVGDELRTLRAGGVPVVVNVNIHVNGGANVQAFADAVQAEMLRRARSN